MSIICEEDAQHHHMPDYAVRLDNGKVRFGNRNTMKPVPYEEQTLFPLLDTETYNEARIVAHGYDVYYLEQQWREFWVASGKPELKTRMRPLSASASIAVVKSPIGSAAAMYRKMEFAFSRFLEILLFLFSLSCPLRPVSGNRGKQRARGECID